MSDKGDPYTRRMLEEMFKGLLIASEVEQDGKRAAYVDGARARAACILMLAAILECSPSLKTPKEIREATQSVERETRLLVTQLREQFLATGKRPFPVIVSS